MRRFSAVAVPHSVRLGGLHPSRFGSGRRWLRDRSPRTSPGLSANLRLFTATYAAGFLFVSLFIA